MTKGAYILMQNPLTNGYPYQECITCCLDIFDEILIVDGGTNDGSFEKLPKDDCIKIIKRDWPEDASWDYLCEQYNYGLQNLTTDWRMKVDADYIFHEKDIQNIKNLFQSSALGYTFEKYCFNLIDRYRTKTKILLAVNYSTIPNVYINDNDQFQNGDKIYFDTDFINSGIPVYNYDNCFKTKKNIGEVMHKLATAAAAKYGINWGYDSKEKAIEFMTTTARTRFDGHNQNIIKIEDHPKYIQDKIRQLKQDKLGYSLFDYKIASYYENN
jgi:hypothetical protein